MAADLDITTVRMAGIVRGVCDKCDGNPHVHTPKGYGVRGVLEFSRDRPDHAIALYALTRGTAVVLIDGYAHRTWWFPTQEQGLLNYREVLYPLFRETVQDGPVLQEGAT